MATGLTQNEKGKTGAVVSLAVVGVLSVFLFYDAGTIAAPGRLPGQIGPGFWPRLLLGLMFLLAGAKIVQLLRSTPRPHAGPQAVQTEASAGEEPDRSVVIAAAVMVFGFVFAIHFLGFFLATLVFLWVFTYLGKWRRKGLLAVIAVLGTVAVNYLFLKIIYVPLPKGQYVFEDITVMIYRALGIF
jgi:hypothetical protein